MTRVSPRLRGALSPVPAFFATAFLGCIPASTPAYDPFVAPEAQVRAAIDAVVATPLVFPEDLNVSPAAAASIDSLIETSLVAGGIRVVPVVEYARIWDRILRQMGGVYDPITGALSDDKFDAARRELLRELRGRFGTDVMLYAELEIVEADVDGGVAKWDGTSQPVLVSSTMIKEQFRDTFQEDEYGGQRYGTISAVSLAISIDDADGRELYKHFGGVEVLSKMGLGNSAFPYELIADAARIAYAVGIVVGPLAGEEAGSTVQR